MVFSVFFDEEALELEHLITDLPSRCATPASFMVPAATSATKRQKLEKKRREPAIPVEQRANALIARHGCAKNSGRKRRLERAALLATGKHPKPPGKPPAGCMWDYEVGKWAVLDGSLIEDAAERRKKNNAAHRHPKGARKRKNGKAPAVAGAEG